MANQKFILKVLSNDLGSAYLNMKDSEEQFRITRKPIFRDKFIYFSFQWESLRYEIEKLIRIWNI